MQIFPVSNVQGTGLGFNIVKMYVELLEGEIEFKSELNVGSTLRLVISDRIEKR